MKTYSALDFIEKYTTVQKERKEMNTLILQRCIKLINSDSKDLLCFQKITISHKSFKTFYSAKNPKNPNITVSTVFLERV